MRPLDGRLGGMWMGERAAADQTELILSKTSAYFGNKQIWYTASRREGERPKGRSSAARWSAGHQGLLLARAEDHGSG